MWVEIPRWLISEDDIWIMNEGSSDTDTLSFSSGKSFDKTLLFMKESNSREYFWNFLPDIAVFIPTYLHGKCDIFTNCLGPEEFEILKYYADTAAVGEKLFFRIGINIPIWSYEKLSGFRFQISDEHLDKARFSTSRTTDKEHELSGINSDIGISQNILIPVCKSDIFYFHGEDMIINAHIIQKKDILQAMFARFLFLW